MIRRLSIAVCLATACGGPEPHAADAPIGPVDAMPPPSESHALGLNDISMLFQLPDDPVTGTTLARMTGVPGETAELVPRDVFAALVTTPGDVGYAYEAFHVVALRFDLCDRTLAGPCPVGEDGRLRLVLQPVITGAVAVEGADVGLHAFYRIPAADLAGVVVELRALARLRDFQTESPLAINEALTSTSPPSEYRARLRALVARYAVADNLVRLTLFAQDAGAAPFNWVFRGTERVGAAFEDMQIPTISAAQQRTILDETLWPPGFTSTPFADFPAGIALATDAQAFAMATLNQRRAALAGLAAADNPTVNGFATEQCVGCHVSTFLTKQRAAVAGVDVDTIAGRFTSARNLSVELGVAADTATSLRAFGWHHQYPAISQRVANETALALDEIDARFPPAGVTVLPDAAVPDAVPTVKRVFVASGQHDGDLATAGAGIDGLDGADRLCAAAAASGGLGGSWVAWLSTDTVNAIDRITGDGPWYLVDATTLVFPSKAAILAFPMARIDLDEHGAQPPDAENVWTGTAIDGTAIAGHACLGWTSNTADSNVAAGMIGLRSATDGGWTEYTDTLCSVNQARLYCFEQ